MTKEERLRSGESLMSHAMVFTGYDKREKDEWPNKWRVENRYAYRVHPRNSWTWNSTQKYSRQAQDFCPIFRLLVFRVRQIGPMKSAQKLQSPATNDDYHQEQVFYHL